jgi:hypothetical protein
MVSLIVAFDGWEIINYSRIAEITFRWGSDPNMNINEFNSGAKRFLDCHRNQISKSNKFRS